MILDAKVDCGWLNTKQASKSGSLQLLLATLYGGWEAGVVLFFTARVDQPRDTIWLLNRRGLSFGLFWLSSGNLGKKSLDLIDMDIR